MNFKGSHIFMGMIAGLIGGLAAAFIFWGAWLLPVMGLILTRANIIFGILTVLIMGLLGGIIYALITGTRRLSLTTTLFAGVVLGLAVWFFGILLLVPSILGQRPLTISPFGGFIPLLSLLLYGIIVSLIYNRWLLMKSKSALQVALGLLFLSIILAPIMLKAAHSTDESDLQIPDGLKAQVIAKGLNYPTSVVITEDGTIYIAEAGFAKGAKVSKPRIVKLDDKGQVHDLGGKWEEPINGLVYNNGFLYVSHKGKISSFDLKESKQKDLITGLPSFGDYQNNDLVFGHDGALYFGQGTATNAGIVGSDNFLLGWLTAHPDFHDEPTRNFVLTGENYEGQDLTTINPKDKKTTGPFSPFGEEKKEGEEIKGKKKANGAILRYDPNTDELMVYADGLRNPYGLAVGSQGELFATNQGYDDRGPRAVKGSPDWLLEIKEGAWYGWPDYAGLIPLSSQEFVSERGVNRKPLIANQPDVEPPLIELPPHSGPMKLSCAPEGFITDGIYVAVFGDEGPWAEDMEKANATGILRVDPAEEDFTWFIKTKDEPRAGRFGGGLNRVIDVKFDPRGGDMYILDFGVVEYTDSSTNAVPNTGVLWQVSPKEVAKVQPKEKNPLPKPTPQTPFKKEEPPTPKPSEEPPQETQKEPSTEENQAETPNKEQPAEEAKEGQKENGEGAEPPAAVQPPEKQPTPEPPFEGLPPAEPIMEGPSKEGPLDEESQMKPSPEETFPLEEEDLTEEDLPKEDFPENEEQNNEGDLPVEEEKLPMEPMD